MKIAVILPEARKASALNEIGHFISRSEMAQTQFEGWLLPENEYSEPLLEGIGAQFARSPVDMLLFPSGWQGAELATRLAYRLQGEAWGAVSEASFAQQVVRKRAYGGALVAALRLQNKPWCLSVAAAPGAKTWQPEIEYCQIPVAEQRPAWLVESAAIEDETASGLAEASLVLAVGRGVGSPQAMAQVEDIALGLGMETGASREAVMHAWCSMDKLLGMSGTQVAADVCIAAGVSGAPAFISGIAHSRFIVAINHDPQAAIFRHADVGIVDDLLPVLTELQNCVREDI
ncbi:electron transfer flavoprotein subunit alpha/FixB family protein [Cedecea neteri]|uniref:electron transfer flavoprotein subunit alpha/FixB family protein n=1 Tax=Cedecea neteri TaxID=158822 RepID=UPI002AA681C2|nr:electron transfer flavoprotein subunit alpha/FixB family protein [Cedecea neteri]WPU23886.1 electron transfer flavoprotein subunit alpha/FixB family protein [Cedecea neteri]